MKKKKNFFLLTMTIIFLIFFILYISKEAGYYEYKAHSKAALTQEQIKKFESDLSKGKNVTIDDYVVNDKVDYSTTIGDIGYKFGNIVESFMNDGLKKALKFFSALFYE